MTKTISIIMATIIMLTAGVNTELITASVKAKPSPHTNKKKKHKHYMPKGNMGKWFKSKKTLKKYIEFCFYLYYNNSVLDRGQ